MARLLKQSPSTASVSLRDKLAYNATLLRGQFNPGEHPGYAWELGDIDEYAELCARFGDMALAQARVLEIGYGARPIRLLCMHARGIDAIGIDIEVPVLLGSPREFARVFRQNGMERTVKSVARHVLGDRRDRRVLRRELAERGQKLVIEPERFLVGDAGAVGLHVGQLDVIVSEDVFEHIPADRLPSVVDNMARWLRPGGVALIRPMVWTGIYGGHDAPLLAGELDGVEPWAHLRERARQPNTFLNRLHRRDYRELFERRFEIVHEQPRDPDAGRERLTPEIRAELGDLPDDELFSNQVMFVLRPRVHSGR